MNFRTFTQTFNEYLPLSVLQIKLQQRDFDMQQLYLRERKGRLHSLIKGRRIHPKALQEIGIGAMIANNIYEPSYLSLQRALRYYNLIPEGVSQYTSCTTKKTQTHNIPAGSFVYRSIAPRYYRWYNLYTIGRYSTIRIASPEKTMCDYLYLHKDIESREDLEEMRINVFVWQEIASEELLLQYASKYPKTTQKRIQTFLSYIHTYDV